ncbi:bifunctional allantoicase/(S)-ureidoglycine aminohydrolase [Tateyamaria sp.]|uniref:bifunctional allantoicase/(S)-ureidoglycine aminohydrolase n=1 Tax=Tateyamaria sp. TaxID=1929288 RepID=UPI003B2209FC
MSTYAFPPGGMPDMGDNPESTAIFTEAYAVLPASTQRDIVTSFLPDWTGTRVWVLARPLSGFAETFAQYALELAPEGGSNAPEPDRDAQAVLFVAYGAARLTMGPATFDLEAGSYAYLPPGSAWTLWNRSEDTCGVHWIRKRYVQGSGYTMPEAFVTHDRDVAPSPMPNSNGDWATQRFVDPFDLNHDMHVNIVNFRPGGRIPFAETHVMEHGLYVLEGTAEYLLNKDWVSVGPGDFMWLRAFCPQACIATGEGPFRYLLYKDVNRHVPL